MLLLNNIHVYIYIYIYVHAYVCVCVSLRFPQAVYLTESPFLSIVNQMAQDPLLVGYRNSCLPWGYSQEILLRFPQECLCESEMGPDYCLSPQPAIMLRKGSSLDHPWPP